MRKCVAIGVLVWSLLGINFSEAEAQSKSSSIRTLSIKKASTRKRRKKSRRKIPTFTKDGKPNILSKAVVVIDMKTGEELFAKNADKKRSIASISKLAAALAVRSVEIDLDGVTEISARDAEITKRGSRPHIKVGAKITNYDLLYSSLIASENRAVPAMGRGAGLTEKQLIAQMNEVAKNLNLKHTFFDETTGLSYNNKSTAREVAKLLKAAIEDETLADAMMRRTFEIIPVDPKGSKVTVWNTNHLLRSGKHTVLGGKTGFNNEAGYCLATSLRVNGKDLLIVVLGAGQPRTRYGDVGRILSWFDLQTKKPQEETTP